MQIGSPRNQEGGSSVRLHPADRLCGPSPEVREHERVTEGPRTIDVVVLTWNDGAALQAAVDSALGSEDVDIEVTIWDNGSVPCASVPGNERVHLLRSETNVGVSAGRNTAVRSRRAPFVCFLDSDARLAPRTLVNLLEPLRKQPDIALAAPVFVDQEPEASAGVVPSVWRKGARMLGLSSRYRRPTVTSGRWYEVDFAIGACQLFRRSAFEGVGGLDERYFYGPEDVDFCLRLRKAGWRIVQVPGASCEHPPRRRYRRPFSLRGLQHACAVTRHLWRHRDFGREMRRRDD